MSKRVIAIDGPSGSGKSSLARALAKKLDYMYIDTGALYRTVGLYMFRSNIDPENEEAVSEVIDKVDLSVAHIEGCQHVFLADEDVSQEIRRHEMSYYASAVSAHSSVRAFLLDIQRSAAEKTNVILDGRDIGTVIFPNADVKIFLTASNEVRAKRRLLELQEKGQDVTYDQVLADIIDRDKRDSSRSTAPLRKADDAIELDNGELTFEETVEAAEKIINGKIN